MCDRYDKCRLACNVCGGITIVLYGRSCDLCVLDQLLFVDLFGSPGYRAVLAFSWLLPSSCLDYQRFICFICLCWPQAPCLQHYTIALHNTVLPTTAALLQALRAITYRLTSVGVSLCHHLPGYTSQYPQMAMCLEF